LIIISITLHIHEDIDKLKNNDIDNSNDESTIAEVKINHNQNEESESDSNLFFIPFMLLSLIEYSDINKPIIWCNHSPLFIYCQPVNFYEENIYSRSTKNAK